MKKSMLISNPVVLILLAVSMIFLFIRSSSGQDTVAKKPQKVMKIKLDMDEDGESVSIDTAFILDDEESMEQFQQAMKQYHAKMKKMGKYMNQLDIELDGEELEKAMQEVQSSLQDTYIDISKRGNFYRNARGARHREHFNRPGNFHFYGPPERCREAFRVKPPKKGESLSDVLGDIPMSAVKSYKIKETKNGKRITIEISDDIIFNHDEDIFIWHGDIPSPPPPPKIKREVFIERNIEKEEKSE